MAKKSKVEPLNAPFDGRKNVTIETIAQHILVAADRIYRYHITVALGQEQPEGVAGGDIKFQQKILKVVEPMLKDYQESKKLDASSSGEVIKLLSKGKINANEALSLLKVIQTKIQVEEAELEQDLLNEVLTEIDGIEDETDGS